jgi:hypothetical protein
MNLTDLVRPLARAIGPNTQVLSPADDDALLVTDTYVLWFSADQFGAEVTNLERKGNKVVGTFALRPLTMDRFTARDRSKYGSPTSRWERIAASAAVTESGLLNHCQDLLSGDTGWLRRDAWSTHISALRAAGIT